MSVEPDRETSAPVVLVAFSGWNDAGESATEALNLIIGSYPSQELSDGIDNEIYWDYTEQRPEIVLTDDGGERYIVWPEIKTFLVQHPEREIVCVLGPEPALRWRSFVTELTSRIAHFAPSMVITVGCMVTDDPHTRPLPVVGHASDEQLAADLGVEPETYTGPTGMTGLLHRACAERNIAAASLWGSTPHYSPARECPKATLALLRRLSDALGVQFDEGSLPIQIADWEDKLNSLAEADADLARYVADLEAAQDADLNSTTGDDIAAQFQRWLGRSGPPSGGRP